MSIKIQQQKILRGLNPPQSDKTELTQDQQRAILALQETFLRKQDANSKAIWDKFADKSHGEYKSRFFIRNREV